MDYIFRLKPHPSLLGYYNMASTDDPKPLMSHRANAPQTIQPSGFGSTIIPSLGVLRGLIGVQLLAVPQLTCRLMLLDTPPSTTILPRLAGTREVGLGALTWFAYKGFTSGSYSANDLRRVLLWGNILVDGMDVIACILVFVSSPEEASAGLLLAATGSFAVLLGFLGLRSV